jgi:hypothetical protein
VKKITQKICAIAFHTSLCDKHLFVGNFTQICVKLTQACVKLTQACVKFCFTQGLCEFCQTRKTQNSKSVKIKKLLSQGYNLHFKIKTVTSII